MDMDMRDSSSSSSSMKHSSSSTTTCSTTRRTARPRRQRSSTRSVYLLVPLLLLPLRVFFLALHVLLVGSTCSSAFMVQKKEITTISTYSRLRRRHQSNNNSSNNCYRCSKNGRYFTGCFASTSQNNEPSSFKKTTKTTTTTTTISFLDNLAPTQLYQHEDWTLSYRTCQKQVDKEKEEETKMTKQQQQQQQQQQQPPPPLLLLIHPVGIGMASWFWLPFLREWCNSSSINNNKQCMAASVWNDDDDDDAAAAAYAVDLIGCGLAGSSSNNNNRPDAWDPNTKDLTLPLDWTRACETLMMQQQQHHSTKQKWTVIVQGGLAPVGVQLAHRNPDLIHRLVLCSPPTWKDMVTAIQPSELERNYQFLQSRWLGEVAFRILESPTAIRFFSNQFLFRKPCDELWMEFIQREGAVVPAARTPVQAFNAGLLQQQSWQVELQELSQSVLVLQGTAEDDERRRRRQQQRNDYVTHMRHCRVQTVEGKNVLPWESPREVCRAVEQFCLE